MMEKNAVMLLAAGLALTSACGLAMGAKGPRASDHRAPMQREKPRSAQDEDEGERVFATQCSRCHAAPQTLPGSAARTIVRHMRTRANLTAEQERALLQYIAP